jgi:hypothetical protein
MCEEKKELPYCIVRPSIIGAAKAYPFPVCFLRDANFFFSFLSFFLLLLLFFFFFFFLGFGLFNLF